VLEDARTCPCFPMFQRDVGTGTAGFLVTRHKRETKAPLPLLLDGFSLSRSHHRFTRDANCDLRATRGCLRHVRAVEKSECTSASHTHRRPLCNHHQVPGTRSNDEQ